MHMEIGVNRSYGFTGQRTKETAFVEEEDIYDLPEVVEVKKDESLSDSRKKRKRERKPQASKKKSSCCYFVFAVVALLGLAFGIAALAFSIARSSNQELSQLKADASLVSASENISSLKNRLQEAYEKLDTQNRNIMLLRQDMHELQTKVPYCGGPGWRRIAFLNMTDESQTCPTGLAQTNYSIRGCGVAVRSHTGVCDSATFSVGSQYHQVCGRALAYRQNNNLGFFGGFDIDGSYVNGLSITHGSPRQHIWTFAGGLFNGSSGDEFTAYRCPCDPGSTIDAPSFVGSDYFCESVTTADSINMHFFFPDNPLWDGSGCEDNYNTCCLYNNPPWFTRQLPSPTADDIEVRLCRQYNDFLPTVALNLLELYVH